MNKRVVVAMSGGVDSSVAAALLKGQGYEVIGITMCFNIPDSSARRKPACCSIKGVEDARRVAHKLNIRHYTLNMQKDLKELVINDFCKEYLKGRTPNPCVRCNQYLKFGILLEKGRCLDADYLATGHYARIVKTERGYQLRKAKDLKKDQSYFLYRLGQAQLRHILFPLGDYTKDEVRRLAEKLKLPVAKKPASQEICFLPEVSYHNFLKTHIKIEIKPGSVVDREGLVLGRHKGIAFYTVGQREGLGIARGYPLYICEIDYRKNRITVGRREDAQRKEFLLNKAHFILGTIKNKIVAGVRIRYNHKEAEAEVIPYGKYFKVRFKEPQFAITPGQSAVFYDRDTVLGGGIINKILG